ncbi:hypothetical protein BC936DRAFT_144933 [Jimgerdemannia flammicorona]|uniref:Metallo-beta-lactamase domain-containing protein n=1 Tax=Jimgerdemannia flammicorona TaxID=994334 RepID=A0A433DLW6_9FUNG|nr:hypothetical protein BC936DRAFT_144933 [Jimgerdemannia flammicorona]
MPIVKFVFFENKRKTMTETLVSLPSFARLSERVWRILGLNPGKFTLQGTNTYLIGTGPRKLLLDCGEGRSEYISLLRTSLATLGANTTISDIIITHTHRDHWGGLEGILSTFPGPIRVHKYPWPANHLQSPVNVHTIPAQFDVIPLRDGQRIKPEGDDGTTLTVLYTPGHCEDHCCFLLEEENTLFTADCVLGQGTAVFNDLAEYVYGLKKLIDIVPGQLYPGHGPVIKDGVAKLTEYVRHREDREQEIIRVLKSGEAGYAWSAMEIVRVVYKGYPERLFAPAAAGVRLHLKKLMGEGKVVVRAGRISWQEGGHLENTEAVEVQEELVKEEEGVERWIWKRDNEARI